LATGSIAVIKKACCFAGLGLADPCGAVTGLRLGFAVVTASRDCVATSTLKGEVAFPLLPDGENREIAASLNGL
jgi:hypothetical protein